MRKNQAICKIVNDMPTAFDGVEEALSYLVAPGTRNYFSKYLVLVNGKEILYKFRRGLQDTHFTPLLD